MGHSIRKDIIMTARLVTELHIAEVTYPTHHCYNPSFDIQHGALTPLVAEGLYLALVQSQILF